MSLVGIGANRAANKGLLYRTYTQVFWNADADLFAWNKPGIHMSRVELLRRPYNEIVGNLHNDGNGILLLNSKHQAVAAGALTAKRYTQAII